MKRTRHHSLPLIVISICFLLPATMCLAQKDSIREEILNYTVPNNELIYRGRKMIVDKVAAGDREKVKMVMTYLVDSAEDKDYLAFTPIERWLLYYWLGQYEKILSDASQFEAFLSLAEMRRVPIQDALRRDLAAKVGYERLKVQIDINSSGLPPMEKAFLVLNLDYITDDGNKVGSQESINDACNGFLSLYPNSEYEPYIRKYLRFQYKLSTFGFAFDLSSGYGILTGDLSTKFTNVVPIAIAADLSYSRFVLFLRVCGGFGLTRDSINFSKGTWAGNSSTTVTVPEASLGYQVYANRSLQVTPFTGISSILISPSSGDRDKYPEYKHVGFQTMSYSLGLNLDFKLRNSDGGGMFGPGPVSSHTFVRVRYTYNHQLAEEKNARFSGNLHYLTIGIGWAGRATKREL